MGGGLVLRAILVITGFSALPLMMDRGVSGKSFLANLFRALQKIILDADDWCMFFNSRIMTWLKNNSPSLSHIAIIPVTNT